MTDYAVSKIQFETFVSRSRPVLTPMPVPVPNPIVSDQAVVIETPMEANLEIIKLLTEMRDRQKTIEDLLRATACEK